MKKIDDYVNVSDSPDSKIRGVVSCYLNGQHLFTKENTIVGTGRAYIMESFLRYFLYGESDALQNVSGFALTTDSDEYKLYGIYLGEGSQSTTSSFSSADFQKRPNVRYHKTDTTTVENEFAYFKSVKEILKSADININDKRITFKCNFEGDEDNPATIQELGIFLKNFNKIDGTFKIDGKEVLFSRLVFDPVIVGAGSSFDLEYSIYF